MEGPLLQMKWHMLVRNERLSKDVVWGLGVAGQRESDILSTETSTWEAWHH